MTVEEMLSRISSRELTEWLAYERHAGPVGPRYISDALADIHEQIQAISHWVIQVNLDKNKTNPVEVKPYPRAHELYEKAKTAGSE